MRERGFGAAVEKEPLRLAVLSAGGIGRLHVERIARSGEARLVAICDPAPAARALAEAHHARHHHTLESMLLTEALDGVIIATPTCLHARQAAACIAEKLPVLVEKPIADNFDEARKLVATAKKAGVSILVGHHRRHNPLAAEAGGGSGGSGVRLRSFPRGTGDRARRGGGTSIPHRSRWRR
jgi:predicted dehydrogenase